LLTRPNHMPEVKPGKYQHFKGNFYEVLGVAKHSENSENSEELVVYRALYGKGELWVRPVGMFFGTIEKDGQQVPRFKFIE